MKRTKRLADEALRSISMHRIPDPLSGDDRVAVLRRIEAIRRDPRNQRAIGIRLPLGSRFPNLGFASESKASFHDQSFAFNTRFGAERRRTRRRAPGRSSLLVLREFSLVGNRQLPTALGAAASKNGATAAAFHALEEPVFPKARDTLRLVRPFGHCRNSVRTSR
jgi:hypothetical protein